MAEETSTDLSLLTATVVAAYASHNKLSTGELAELIGSTYQALDSAGQGAPAEPETPKPDKAAIKRSNHPDYLTSFVDGRRYKSLTRHLNANDLTPAAYRERYGLPKDYPMVAQNYSAHRSALAKSLGLGRRPASEAAPAKPTTRRKNAERPQASRPERDA